MERVLLHFRTFCSLQIQQMSQCIYHLETTLVLEIQSANPLVKDEVEVLGNVGSPTLVPISKTNSLIEIQSGFGM